LPSECRRRRLWLAVVGLTFCLPGLRGLPGEASAASGWTSTATPLPPVQQNSHLLPGLGRDNGQSAGYAGRSYWVFADTLLRTDPAGLRFLDNTAAVTSDAAGSDGLTVTSSNLFTEDPNGQPDRFIPWLPREVAFAKAHAAGSCVAGDPYCGATFALWPGAIVADPARKRLLMSVNKLCRGGASKCTSGYVGTGIGTGLVAIDPARRRITRLPTVHNSFPVDSPEGVDPTLLFDSAHSISTAFAHGGMLYVLLDCRAPSFVCAVGRVPLSAPTDLDRWSFYQGTSHGRQVWDWNLWSAARVTPTGAAGGTIQWVPAMKAFLNTYMVPLGNDAVFRTGPTPVGPWSDEQVMFRTVPGGTSPNYALFAHPEFATDGGLVQYVTYYNSGTGMTQLQRVHFCAAAEVVCPL
jgi:hypothetical protein